MTKLPLIFSVQSENGPVNFSNQRIGGAFHTTMKVEDLERLLGKVESIPCDVRTIMRSITLYIDGDNYLSDSLNLPCGIMQSDGLETLGKLKFLKATHCGVFLKPLGYRIGSFDINKVYHWLNDGGIRSMVNKRDIAFKATPENFYYA